jgi:hypothetical protein
VKTATPTTTATVVRHTPPRITIGCPATSVSSAPTVDAAFGHTTTAGDSDLTSWEIAYGDGHSFSSASGEAVFEHTYDTPGVYAVKVTVTDGNGLTGSDSCVWAWTRPSPLPTAPAPTYAAPAVPAAPAPSAGGSCGTGYYRNVNGDCIPSPDSTPSGIQCRDGTYSHAVNRQGACSGHGGIA